MGAHYREIEPRIGIGHNEKPGLMLTPEEALQLLDKLGELVAIARGEVESRNELPRQLARNQ